MRLQSDVLRLRKIGIQHFGIFVFQSIHTVKRQEQVIAGSNAINFKFSLERAAHFDQVSRAARLYQQNDCGHHVIGRGHGSAHARRIVPEYDLDRLRLRSLRHRKVFTEQVDATAAQRLYVPRPDRTIGLNRIYTGSNALECICSRRPPVDRRPRRSRRWRQLKVHSD
jgi:hypothetical protein